MATDRIGPLLQRHGPRQLALDALFVGWAVFFMVSGSLVPGPIEAMFHQDPPASVVVEPQHDTDQAPTHPALLTVEPQNPA